MIVFLSLLAIILLVLVIAAISGKQMTIERSITISAPAQKVFDFVSHIKNHDQFSVWHMMDPQMKKTFRGSDGQVGFVYAWDSANDKNVGAGEQEIVEILPGTRVRFHVRFQRPMKSEAYATMTTTPQTDGTTLVQWTFDGPMKFPMNIMKPIMENMLGKQLAQGLANLKNVLEK